MANPPKKKGTAFESLIRDYLKVSGFPNAERLSLTGALDRGDLTGVSPLWTLECKSYKNLTDGIRIGMADLDREQANANTPFGALIVKRPRVTDPGAQLVVTELWVFAALLKQQEQLHHLLTSNNTGSNTHP